MERNSTVEPGRRSGVLPAGRAHAQRSSRPHAPPKRTPAGRMLVYPIASANHAWSPKRSRGDAPSRRPMQSSAASRAIRLRSALRSRRETTPTSEGVLRRRSPIAPTPSRVAIARQGIRLVGRGGLRAAPGGQRALAPPATHRPAPDLDRRGAHAQARPRRGAACCGLGTREPDPRPQPAPPQAGARSVASC